MIPNGRHVQRSMKGLIVYIHISTVLYEDLAYCCSPCLNGYLKSCALSGISLVNELVECWHILDGSNSIARLA